MQKSYQNGFHMVRSSTEDQLSRDLFLDRPSFLWISVPQAPGPRWRENRRRRLPAQKCVLAVIRHAMATPGVCDVFVDSLEISVGSVVTPVL